MTMIELAKNLEMAHKGKGKKGKGYKKGGIPKFCK